MCLQRVVETYFAPGLPRCIGAALSGTDLIKSRDSVEIPLREKEWRTYRPPLYFPSEKGGQRVLQGGAPTT